MNAESNQIIFDALAKSISQTKKLHGRWKPRMMVMRSNIKNKLLGKQKTKTILGFKLKIVIDDSIFETKLKRGHYQSDIYIV